jgi:hypothetical protein
MLGSPALHGLEGLEPQFRVPRHPLGAGPDGHGLHERRHVERDIGPAEGLHFQLGGLDGLGIAFQDRLLQVLRAMRERNRGGQAGSDRFGCLDGRRRGRGLRRSGGMETDPEDQGARADDLPETHALPPHGFGPAGFSAAGLRSMIRILSS